MDKYLQDKLIKGAQEFGCAVSADQLELFDRYAEELLFWNRIAGLTSNRTLPEIVDSMFLDSLSFSLLDFPLSGLKACDFGTGGGFPGIPLKIIYPDLQITLIDSSSKKCGFLEKLSVNLGFKDVAVVCARGEELAGNDKFRSFFDLVFTRACADMASLIELIFPIMSPSGTLVAWKGPLWIQERKKAAAAMRRFGAVINFYRDYKVAGTDAVKTLVGIKKDF